MDFFSIPLFQVVRERMSFLESRQNAISENIAQADIPKYRARDVSDSDFARMIEHGEGLGVQLAATNSKHLTGTRTNAAGAFRLKDMPDREISPNGNTVVLEDQMMKLGQTQMSHQLATGIYRKAVDMLRLAIHRA